ncbi:MAG: hypothetical protein ACUVQP_03650, partial [Bacteroidales bacterium]
MPDVNSIDTKEPIEVDINTIINAPPPENYIQTPPINISNDMIQVSPIKQDIIRQPVFTLNGADIATLKSDEARRYNEAYQTLNELGMLKPIPQAKEGFWEGTISRLVEYTPKEAVEILKGLFDPRVYDEQAKAIFKQKLQEYVSTDDENEKRRIEMEMYEAILPLYDDIMHRSTRVLYGTGYALTIGGILEGIQGVWRTLKRGAKLIATPFQIASGNKTYEQFKNEWFNTMEHPISTSLDAIFTSLVGKLGVRGISNLKNKILSKPELLEKPSLVESEMKLAEKPAMISGVKDLEPRTRAEIIERIEAEARAGKLPKEFYEGEIFNYPKYADHLAIETIGKGITKPTPEFEMQLANKVFDNLIQEKRKQLKENIIISNKEFLEKAKEQLKQRAQIDEKLAKMQSELIEVRNRYKEIKPVKTEGETLFPSELEKIKQEKLQLGKKITELSDKIKELNIKRNQLTNTIEKIRGKGKLPTEVQAQLRQAAQAITQIVKDRDIYRTTKQLPDYVKKEIENEWNAIVYNTIGDEIGVATRKQTKYNIDIPDEVKADLIQRAKIFNGEMVGNIREASEITTSKSNDTIGIEKKMIEDFVDDKEKMVASKIPEAEIIAPETPPLVKPSAPKGTIEYDIQLEKIALEKEKENRPLTIEEFARLADVKEVGLEYLKKFKQTNLLEYIKDNITDKVVRIPISVLDYRNILDFLREMGLPELARIQERFWELQVRLRHDYN